MLPRSWSLVPTPLQPSHLSHQRRSSSNHSKKTFKASTPSCRRVSMNSLSTHLTMCLSRLTLRHAFRTCFCKVWPTCQLVHALQEVMCKPTRKLHHRSVLSTRPTWPSRTDRQHGFHHRVLSSLLTQASSTLPTAAWVKIRLLVQVVHLCLWPS